MVWLGGRSIAVGVPKKEHAVWVVWQEGTRGGSGVRRLITLTSAPTPSGQAAEQARACRPAGPPGALRPEVDMLRCWIAVMTPPAAYALATIAIAIPAAHVTAMADDQAASVVTWAAPAGEPPSPDFQVWAAGRQVDTYTARVLDAPFDKGYDHGGPYSFASFDMSGRVQVRITSKRPLTNAVILPASYGIKPTLLDEHTLTFTLDRPRKISIEPDGKKGPLLLFANPLETDAPRADDPNVIYFGPGVHKPERITLTSNQTLYLAGGAVVKAEVLAEGQNIRIAGRGILDGSDWAWLKGPLRNLITIRNSSEVEVSGITLRGSPHWTLVLNNSRRIAVRNLKICNARVQNDDGINPCNSQDILITDCFIRTDDDCVAMKGLDLNAPNNNVERITVEDSTLWCDRARVFLLGHESRARFMRNITLRNLDIIHFSMTAFLLEPGEDMHLEDVAVENVRVHGEGQRELIRLKPTVNQYMRNKVPGFIRNVSFSNISVEGRPGSYLVQLEGASADSLDVVRQRKPHVTGADLLGVAVGVEKADLRRELAHKGHQLDARTDELGERLIVHRHHEVVDPALLLQVLLERRHHGAQERAVALMIHIHRRQHGTLRAVRVVELDPRRDQRDAAPVIEHAAMNVEDRQIPAHEDPLGIVAQERFGRPVEQGEVEAISIAVADHPHRMNIRPAQHAMKQRQREHVLAMLDHVAGDGVEHGPVLIVPRLAAQLVAQAAPAAAGVVEQPLEDLEAALGGDDSAVDLHDQRQRCCGAIRVNGDQAPVCSRRRAFRHAHDNPHRLCLTGRQGHRLVGHHGIRKPRREFRRQLGRGGHSRRAGDRYEA